MLSNKKGFTLIELLIVVVIIGILAAIAIPKFANTKEKAYIASMKADLRNLVTAQEAYFSEWTTYGDWTGDATGNGTGTGTLSTTYSTSAGVVVTTVDVTGAGWRANAIHNGTNAQTCTIFVGSVPGTTATDIEGEPRCSAPAAP